MSSTDGSYNWSLTIRLSNGERFNIEVSSTATVEDCKETIQRQSTEYEVERQRLVYKGRILDDRQRLLSDYGIVHQSTLFLVMSRSGISASTSISSTGTQANTTSAAAPSSSPSAASARAAATSPVNPFLSAMAGADSRNPFAGGQPSAATPFSMPSLNSPPSAQQVQEMMNSPMMQGLMDNPQMMQQVMNMTMQTNPQLRQLLESNPELQQIWNDPQMVQQAMQMMRNPELMQQAMRQQELAMSQLENLPGGFSALSSMYRNIQEPLLEAQENAASASSRTTNMDVSTSSRSNNEGATGAAMPNPWGSPSTTTNTTRSASTSTPAPMANPWGVPSGAGTGAGGMRSPFMMNPWATDGAGASPFLPGDHNMEQHQAVMNQILDNPVMMNMMEQMVNQNPDMIRNMLEAQNPMLRQMFQTMTTQQANDFIRQMMNPQALRSMMQLQQAMSGMPGMPSTSSSSTSSTTSGLDFSNLLGGGTPSTGAPPPMMMPPMLDFNSLMQQFQGGMAPGTVRSSPFPSQPVHPADRYRSQLQSLRDMGFDDEQANLAVLQRNHGNLNRAVDELLTGGVSSTTNTTSAAPDPAPPAQQPQQPPPEPKNENDKKND